MSLQTIAITFSDTVTEEAHTMLAELKIASIIRAVRRGEPLDDAVLADLEHLLTAIVELLDPNLPAIHKDPLETLRLISRDNNLARLLSSRSAARLFRFLQQKNADGVPLFMTLVTDDGEMFTTQNDFIDYLCKHAHMSRSSVFERKRTLERLMHLGYSLEEAYHILVSKPRTVGNVLNALGDWEDNRLVHVDSGVVSQICNKLVPEKTGSMLEMLERTEEDSQLSGDIRDELYPIYQGLLEEVAAHPSATGAMDFVQHDILKQPEISYRWEPQTNALLVDMIQKEVANDGHEYVARVVTIAYEPQYTAAVPQAVVNDLLRRLPIKNRRYLDE